MRRLNVLLVMVLEITLLATAGCSPKPEEATLPAVATQDPTPIPPAPTKEEVLPTNTLLPEPTFTIEPTDTPSPTIEQVESAPFEIWSDAWGLNESIPDKYSCRGDDISPPLSWSEPPEGTESFVLIMDDPDAADVAGYVWDHWLLFNIPGDYQSLMEGISQSDELPEGSIEGANSWGQSKYGGPCPPAGRIHGYMFRLYAIDTLLDQDAGRTKSVLLNAIEGHILAEAVKTWFFPGG